MATSSRPGAASLFVFACVIGLGVAAFGLGGPPAPAPADEPPAEFSAERAMAHVERIAERPHPLGSADHARVRDYLVAALEQMGVAVERQAATIVRATSAVRVGRVENVMARLKGTASSGAVLLVSHYDSVPAAPGAADAGSGVAALLETVRALKAGGTLKNDVMVLFTDGEEFGLLGAAAFVEQHPWAREVRAVVNLEARGTSGPSQMFETSAQNGAVVAEWAATVPKPAGSSLTYEIYKHLPNDTDFTVFRTLDAVGLNFAFIGDWEDYHTSNDAPASLDRGSLQHHGAAALALARRFGTLDLKNLRASDAVYFSLPVVNAVVRYPSFWALPLGLLAVVLYVGIVVRARKRKLTSIGGLLLAVLVLELAGGALEYGGWRFGRLMSAMHTSWLAPGNVLMSAPYAGVLVAAVVTLWCALYVLLRKWFAPHTLALGGLFVWVLASAACAWFVVGGSYVLLWPIVGALLSALALPGDDRRGAPGAIRAVLVCVFAAPAVLILWPLVSALSQSLGLSPENGVAMSLVTLFALATLAPQLELITEGRRWWPAGLAFITTLVCLGYGMSVTPYSAMHPRTVDMFYVLDADARQAHWTARVDQADAWAGQYLGQKPAEGRPRALVPPWSTPTGTPGFLNAGAPVVDAAAPQAALIGSAIDAAAGGRILTLRVTPSREGHVLSVWTNGADVLDAAIDGRAIRMNRSPRAADDTGWTADFLNAAQSGATITLTLKGTKPLTVAVVDRAPGLPEIPGRRFDPRPAWIVPIQSGDQTVVRRTYEF